MKIKKSLTVLMLVAVMLLSAAASNIAANAQEDATTGTFNLMFGTGTGEGWSFASPVLTIQDGGNVEITGMATGRRIAVASGADASIILNNVSLNADPGGTSSVPVRNHPAILIPDGSALDLTVIGDSNALIGGEGPNAHGIQLAGTGQLYINGTGNLHLTAGPRGGNLTGAAPSAIFGGSQVTIGGSVNLTAIGDSGRDATFSGMDATNGSAGISSGSVNIIGNANVTTTGGDGGNGHTVANNPVTLIRGAHGGPGLTVGSQGEINIRDNARLTATGGNGGNGGNIMFSNTQPGGSGADGIIITRGTINIEGTAQVTALGGASGSFGTAAAGNGIRGGTAQSIVTIGGDAVVNTTGGTNASSTASQSQTGFGFRSDAGAALIITGNATVTASGGNRTGVVNLLGGSGISAGAILIDARSTVTATGGNAGTGGAGILTLPGNAVQITDNATVTATGGNNASGIGGDSGPGTIAVLAQATVRAYRGAVEDSEAAFPRSIGRRAQGLTPYTINISPTARVFVNAPADAEITTPTPTPSPGPRHPADINNDGAVNIEDLTLLRLYLAGHEVVFE